MTRFAESYAVWLADYYLLATVLLALALTGIALLKQPAQRLMVTKSTLVALVLLAILCAVPGWSVVHLLAADRPPTPAESVREEPMDPRDSRPYLSEANPVRRAEQPALIPQAADEPPTKAVEPKMSWAASLAIAHVAGMACIAFWLALGWAASVRLRKTAQTAPANVSAILSELASRKSRTSKPLQLFTHDRIDVAVALGVWQPMILLPDRWANSQSHDRLQAVLAHEATHVLNYDLQWVALARILFVALWANPLFWLAKRRLRLDQEALADAAAAEITSRQQYAEQLVAWARDIRSRPALRPYSAVGLWEGPSQLRQRIALLLDERLTIMHQLSRKWQLATIIVCSIAAAALSLITLQPAQSQEKPVVEAAALPTELANPAELVKLSDRFIFCPVTTELQRSLLGDVDRPMSKVSLCVFVNFAELREAPIEASSPFFAGLADQLAAFAKANNELAMFRILLGSPRQMPFDTVHKRAESLSKLCETIGKESGFKSVRSSQTFFNSDFDWTKYVTEVESLAEQTEKSQTSPAERSIGNDRVRVFAVSTFLSRMLAQDTDCVVNIKPIVRPRDGSRFPADFTNSTQEFIPELKYGRNKTMLVRVRFVESEKNTLNQWNNDNDGRRAFARQFGFEYCNMEQSQVAAEDVAKLDHDDAAAEKAVDKKTSSNTSTAADTPAKSDENLQATSWWPTKWPLPNTIRGYAVDENGQPIAGAEAFLFRINRVDGSRKLQAKTKADAQGKYRFANVIDIAKEFPDGKLEPNNPLEEEFVQLYLRAPGRVAGMQMDLRQRIASTGKVYSMKLPPAAKLTGRITGPDGKPVAGALVAIGGSNFSTWDEVASARTKADGTYVISDAAPYGIEEYRKQAEEQNRQIKARAAAKQDTFVAFVTPPVLTVSHPDFAIKNAIYQKIPGNQDVKLEPGAIVEGKAIYGDSAKPAAGVIVHLATSQPKDAKPGEDQFTPNPVAFDTRTDADGKYRFTALPAVSYDLSAEMPGWVISDINALAAPSGKTSTAPNLVLTKGGVISIRLIDDKTGKPIALTPGMRADIAAHKFPFPKGPSRPNWMPNARANPAGRFELHTPPGKRAVMVNQVHENGELRWIPKPSPEFKPTVVDVVDGKTVEVDLAVVDRDPAATWPQGDGEATLFSIEPQIPETNDGKAADKKDPKNNTTPTEPPKSPSKTKSSTNHAADRTDGAKQSIEIPLIVAKHVLLLNGKEITTWNELEAKIAALPDPSSAYPHFYVTHGAMESGVEKDAKPHIWELHQKYKLKGHSEGTLAARTSFRYDKIQTKADLIPDESLRVSGIVLDSKEKPVAGAEVVLITPVDDSLSYKAYDIALVEGRLRNRLDDVVTDTDAAGRFLIYPPKGMKYCGLVLHPSSGINIIWDQSFASESKMHLLPWAALVSELGAEPGAKQTASLRTQVRAQDGYPEINLAQYWSDLKNEKPTNVFGFTRVPPIWRTNISRDFAEPDGGAMGVNGASVDLLPGESRRIDLGPLSDKQREWLKTLLDESKKRSESSRQK
jgi:beta-lactamase regulating signal transducer with metallopeptidase domain